MQAVAVSVDYQFVGDCHNAETGIRYDGYVRQVMWTTRWRYQIERSVDGRVWNSGTYADRDAAVAVCRLVVAECGVCKSDSGYFGEVAA